jgi:histidine ammonia-lyase
MAAHGARRLLRMNANLGIILGVELMCAAQGIEFRAPLLTSPALQKVMLAIRSVVPAIGPDRYLAGDIERAASLVSAGDVGHSAGLPSLLGSGA